MDLKDKWRNLTKVANNSTQSRSALLTTEQRDFIIRVSMPIDGGASDDAGGQEAEVQEEAQQEQQQQQQQEEEAGDQDMEEAAATLRDAQAAE